MGTLWTNKDEGTLRTRVHYGTEETTLAMPQGGALCILTHFVLEWNGKIIYTIPNYVKSP